MLFDLRGRRRRAVQVTYLMLALLMGGGLVLFGIGGSVSGGLIDAFKGGGGGSSTDSALEDRVDKAEERLAANPQNAVVLQNLIRDYYSLATSQRESGTIGFPDDAKDDLRKAGVYWQRYTQAVTGEPSAEAARYALQVYDVAALNRAQGGAEGGGDPCAGLERRGVVPAARVLRGSRRRQADSRPGGEEGCGPRSEGPA